MLRTKTNFAIISANFYINLLFIWLSKVVFELFIIGFKIPYKILYDIDAKIVFEFQN